MIEVEQTTNENGKVSFIISWDENDPQESIFNSFTEQDFIDTLMYYCEQELSKLEYTESVSKESGETNDDIEELTEHFFEDTSECKDCGWEERDEYYSYYHKENNEAQ